MSCRVVSWRAGKQARSNTVQQEDGRYDETPPKSVPTTVLYCMVVSCKNLSVSKGRGCRRLLLNAVAGLVRSNTHIRTRTLSPPPRTPSFGVTLSLRNIETSQDAIDSWQHPPTPCLPVLQPFAAHKLLRSANQSFGDVLRCCFSGIDVTTLQQRLS